MHIVENIFFLNIYLFTLNSDCVGFWDLPHGYRAQAFGRTSIAFPEMLAAGGCWSRVEAAKILTSS